MVTEIGSVVSLENTPSPARGLVLPVTGVTEGGPFIAELWHPLCHADLYQNSPDFELKYGRPFSLACSKRQSGFDMGPAGATIPPMSVPGQYSSCTER